MASHVPADSGGGGSSDRSPSAPYPCPSSLMPAPFPSQSLLSCCTFPYSSSGPVSWPGHPQLPPSSLPIPAPGIPDPGSCTCCPSSIRLLPTPLAPWPLAQTVLGSFSAPVLSTFGSHSCLDACRRERAPYSQPQGLALQQPPAKPEEELQGTCLSAPAWPGQMKSRQHLARQSTQALCRT